MKRTTVSLPDEMMEKAREKARSGRADEPENLSRYIRELVRRDLNGELLQVPELPQAPAPARNGKTEEAA